MPLTNFPNGVETGGLKLAPQTLTASGAVRPGPALVFLDHATVIVAATTSAPEAGEMLVVVNTSASGTAAHTVTLPAGVTWDGTNNTATLNAPGEALVAVAISATEYVVLVNLGSVALSSV
jgi:hypothetical protein